MLDPDVPPDSRGAGPPRGEPGASTLDGLRRGDPGAWRALVELYGPLVYRWCRGAGCDPEAAADVGQEVFLAVVQALRRGQFDRPGGSFMAWVRAIARSKLVDHGRRRARHAEPDAAGGSTARRHLGEVPAPEDGSLDRALAAVRGARFRPAVEQIRSEFEGPTWRAFWATAVERRPAAEVARDLGLSRAAVYMAKSRVLRRFRERYGDLID